VFWTLPWTTYHHIEEVAIHKPNLKIKLLDRHNGNNEVIATLSEFTAHSYKCGNDPKIDRSIVNRIYNRFCTGLKFHGRVQVNFSCEVGEGVDTWKGGVMATSYAVPNNIEYEEMLLYVKKALNKDFVLKEEWSRLLF
jgi:hypothetical protein